MHKMLIEYLRDKNNHRTGVVVADLFGAVDEKNPCEEISLDGECMYTHFYYSLGWSKFNKSKEDGRFNKERGVRIARERASSLSLGKFTYRLIYLEREDKHVNHWINPSKTILPPEVHQKLIEMNERAERYYKGWDLSHCLERVLKV